MQVFCGMLCVVMPAMLICERLGFTISSGAREGGGGDSMLMHSPARARSLHAAQGEGSVKQYPETATATWQSLVVVTMADGNGKAADLPGRRQGGDAGFFHVQTHHIRTAASCLRFGRLSWPPTALHWREDLAVEH